MPWHRNKTISNSSNDLWFNYDYLHGPRKYIYYITTKMNQYSSTLNRCRRSSSTQEQRYPPPLPLGATAPPTCRRRKSDPRLGVTTQDQEYPLRNLREIRDTSNGSWCIGIKGEMSGTVCVTFTWDIYIYIYIYELFIAFDCFVVCSLL